MILVLKALRTPNLFTKAIVKMKEGVKLLATIFLFRYENAFAPSRHGSWISLQHGWAES